MTCSQLTKCQSREWTSAQPSAHDLRWQQFLPAEKFMLNKMAWILVLHAIPSPVGKSGCFSSASWGHLWMTHTGPLLWIQVCGGISPSYHLLFNTLKVKTGVEYCFVLSLSTTALSWWGGAAFLIGPMFPHRRLVTLLTFWCPGQEKLMDGKQVRGGHAVLIRFVRVFYRQA